MRKRFTEEQIVAILRDAESGQKSAGEVCRKHSISVPTFYAWRRSLFGTIVCGTGVMLALKFGMGW